MGLFLFKKNSSIKSKILKTEGMGENKIAYVKHKNTVKPYGRHIYNTAYDMSKSKMCAYPRSDHALPHWKFFMLCCAKCPRVNLPDQENDDQYSNTSP